MPIRLVSTSTAALIVLVPLCCLVVLGSSLDPGPFEAPATGPDDQQPRSLTIDFLGLQDRPLARLVIFPDEDREAVDRYFHCGREASCAGVSSEVFKRLADHLRPRFFEPPTSDPDAQTDGGFRFRLVDTPVRGKESGISLNRKHAISLFEASLQVLPGQGSAHDELARRLTIVSQ